LALWLSETWLAEHVLLYGALEILIDLLYVHTDPSFELYDRSEEMGAAIFAEMHADSLMDAAENQRPNNSQHITLSELAL
jgi:hypothetical protein